MTVALFLLLAVAASAAEPPQLPPSVPAPAAVAIPASTTAAPYVAGVIPGNTLIILELVDTVSSKLQVRGDTFALRLAEPIRSGDRVLVPAGTPAVGEVIHSQKASGGGRAGELTLAARYLDTPFGRIKLRSSFGSAGQDHTKAALATAFIAGPFAMMVHGSDRVLPAGTRVSSKTAVDSDLAHLSDATPNAATDPGTLSAGTISPAVPAAPTLPKTEGTLTQ